MIKINLVPPEYIARINRNVVIAKAVLAVVVVAISVLMASLWHIGRAKAIEVKLSGLEQVMRVLQKDVDKAKEIERQISEVQKYLNSINSINKGRFVYANFLQDIVSDLPSTLWFTSINTTLSGSVVSVSLAVNANSAYDLAYWINSLEISGPYSDVAIGAISVTTVDLGKRFTVPVTVKYTVK